MRILIVGDLHLREKRLGDISRAWEKTVTWAYNNKVDLLVQAGDVFDHPNIYGRDTNVGTIFESFMAPFKPQYSPTRLFVIPGNHDMGGAEDMDALSPLTKNPWITVSRKPEVVNLTPELSICSVPWVNKAQLMSRLTKRGENVQSAHDKVGAAIAGIFSGLAPKVKAEKDQGRFVLFVGHIEVTGSKMHGGQLQAGGSFEFGAQALADIQCDAYALAHIHIRQHVHPLPNENDGYLGSLCQLDFGQEGCDVGCRLIEIEGRKIVRDEFLNNTLSPRYMTVTSLEGLSYRKDVDYVKLRTESRPESLPAGMVWDRIPVASTAKRMTEENLESSTPIRKLLSVWKDFSNCPVPLDDLVRVAERLLSKHQLPPDAVGSLDRIDRTILDHITCHGHTDIDLSRVSGLVAIEGANGSGKTTFVESLPLALFGVSPSREDLKSLIPQGHEGDSSISVFFQSGGKKYVAYRYFKKTPKTFKHEAYLYEAEKFDPKNPTAANAIAGPKIDDVKSSCTAIVGDKSLFFGGPFSSQVESGNLVDLDPAERKELFAKLLGSEKYLVLSEAAKDEAKSDNAIVEAHVARIGRLKIELADETADVARIAELKESISSEQEVVDGTASTLEGAQESLSLVAATRKERERLLAEIAALNQRKADIVTEGKAIKAKKVALEQADSKIKEFESQLSEARKAREEAEAIKQAKSLAEQEAAGLKDQASALRTAASEQKAARMQAHAKMSSEARAAVEALRSERAAQRKPLEDEAKQLEIDIQLKRGEMESAKKRAELLKGFPDVEACKACPLAKDGIEGRDSAPEILKAGKKMAADLKDKKAALADFDGETARLMSAASVPEMDDSWQPKVIAEAAAKLARAAALDQQAANKAKDFDSSRLSVLAPIAASIPSIEKKLDESKDAKVAIAKLDAELNSLKAEHKKADEAIAKIKPPEAQDDTKVQKLVADLKVALKASQDAIAAHTRELGRAEAALEAHQKRKDELAGLQAKVDEKNVDLGVYNALTKACGKDGIPQLIVDSKVPRYQEIMSELMQNFGGKWAIEARTQKEVNKGANVKETFEIIVDDGHGGRDVKTYSGGEKRLLKNIIRIGFSILQAESTGKGLRVLVLDEATENMDHGNVDSFVKMLGMFSKSFNQVFVVSHSEYVLSTMQNKLTFRRTGWPNEWAAVEASFPILETVK